ncbi:MAG TPA: hypothetical protein VKE74_26045 [Gemmataceae bacterium]|nr:hypothetical protein [Gemmataceae bacterium]
MKVVTIRAALAAALLSMVGLAIGCGQTGGGGQGQEGGKGKEKSAVAGGKKVHDHSGWWCDEHGVPEDECSMCSAKVAKEFKAKGDWCEKHDRAKSQCFICDPSLKDKFAVQYRAKEGKEPPEPDGQKEQKGEKK